MCWSFLEHIRQFGDGFVFIATDVQGDQLSFISWQVLSRLDSEQLEREEQQEPGTTSQR